MKPIAIFGEVPNDLKNKVRELKSKVHNLGYDSGEIYLDTVPHLTLSVNAKFEGEAGKLKPIIENLKLEKFSLQINDLIEINNNIAVKFNNSYSSGLAKEIAFALRDFNFEPVETYFMKIVRSEVKPEHAKRVIEMVKEIIPKEIKIIKISAAGGNLTEKDIYWSIYLNE